MKFKLLIPVVALCLFLLTPLTSLAAPAHAAASVSTTTIRPNIQPVSCYDESYTWISYNNGNDLACFAGDGYMGLDLSDVSDIWGGVNCGWVRYYDYTGGHFLPFSSIGDTFLPSTSNNKVTQIDTQGQNCQGHYP